MNGIFNGHEEKKSFGRLDYLMTLNIILLDFNLNFDSALQFH